MPIWPTSNSTTRASALEGTSSSRMWPLPTAGGEPAPPKGVATAAEGATSVGLAGLPSTMALIESAPATNELGSCSRTSQPRDVPSSAAPTSKRTRKPSPKVRMRTPVRAAEPRSKRVRLTSLALPSAGKAWSTMRLQSCCSTRVAACSTPSVRPPSARCHIGMRSYGCVTERVAGPVTMEPFHASCHLPGGIHTVRAVRLAVVL
mmetsp:Transcript_57731/g.158639  ORF Transcript_57731/g.158639 Transcript_57731/m.158639 type:complete len:205 (-) Transcript_57731:510-1124(-)